MIDPANLPRITCPACEGCGVAAGDDCQTCGATGTLEPGMVRLNTPLEVAQAIARRWTCIYCGMTGMIRLEERFQAAREGTWTLSGAQPKAVGWMWRWAICGGCGHESKGKR